MQNQNIRYNTEGVTGMRKKKISLPVMVLLIGVGIGLLLAGFGLYKQCEAKRINEERANTALAQSEAAVKAANERLTEIEKEYNELKVQYDNKADECASIELGSDGWFAKSDKCMREEQELQSRLWNLEAEDASIKNKDYTVYYQMVEPMSYLIFYIIGGSVAGLAALGAFIIYLVKGKRSY